MATNPDSGSTAPARVGRLASVSLDCPDAPALADFYAALLGMSRLFETPDGHLIALTDGAMCVTMMQIEDYEPPTWPHKGQSQQMHLDLAVTDLEPAVAAATALGAREAAHQANPSAWRVLIDPAGHPFCLTTVGVD
jgi:catechol 2,3-dioxygenase-like lactoylglutathione lyase family enzyme